MKKLILFLVLAIGLGSSLATPSWLQSTDRDSRVPLVLNQESWSLLLADVRLDTMDTAYTRPVDLVNVPIAYRDTGTGDAALVPDFTMGSVMVSCFDYSDSAAVTDSVWAVVQPQVSQYAADNANPLKVYSDAWASLGSAVTVKDVSQANAIVEGTAALTLTSDLDRFVRFRILSGTNAIKNRQECRIYWVHKKRNK